MANCPKRTLFSPAGFSADGAADFSAPSPAAGQPFLPPHLCFSAAAFGVRWALPLAAAGKVPASAIEMAATATVAPPNALAFMNWTPKSLVYRDFSTTALKINIGRHSDQRRFRPKAARSNHKVNVTKTRSHLNDFFALQQ
jgi:hypothetical protein